jgi:CheY-like chemotaxis protein
LRVKKTRGLHLQLPYPINLNKRGRLKRLIKNKMKKILIIEDDVQLQKIYQTKFSAEGYEIIQAITGEEALKKVSEGKPDLVVLDIMLPGGMDGFTVLDQLKSDIQTKNIPVFVSTNLDDQAITALSKGAVWYFIKAQTPIADVVAKVKEYLN